MIHEKAHAKINLSLNIERRRDDGYHDISSVFLPLELHDSLEITLANQNSIHCNDPTIPCDESNLIWKAMELVQRTYQREERFGVNLTKRIPSQAGLGGGSSDAAAMLRAMNQMLDLHLPQEELIYLAKQLGADVPFFLRQTPAVVSGIGDQLEEIDFPFPLSVLLVKPNKGVSTKMAYETLCLEKCAHPSTKAIQEAIIKKDYAAMIQNLGNSLEESAFRLVPEIKIVKEALQSLSFDVVLMSGSGSCVFALTQNEVLLGRGQTYFDSYDKIRNLIHKNKRDILTNHQQELYQNEVKVMKTRIKC